MKMAETSPEPLDEPLLPVSPSSTVILSFITDGSTWDTSSLGNTTLDASSGNGTIDGETLAESDGSPPDLLTMILKGIAMGLLMFMALFGNALVIASVIRIRRLRTITNYFVVSLAVADFLVAALVMPFNAIQEILKRWIFPEWVCYFFNSNDVLFCTASVLNLCMVAVDRYVAIVKPLRYHQVMTKRSAALMIASAWTAGLAISYVPIHLNWHLPNFEASPITDYCDFKPSAVYSLASSAISFWLPTFVILFVYGRIYHIAVNQAREMRRLDQHMANVYGRTTSQQIDPPPVVSNSNSVAAGMVVSKQSSLSSAGGAQMPPPLATVSNTANNNIQHSVSTNARKKPQSSTLSPTPIPRSQSMAVSTHTLQPSSGSVGSSYAANSQSRNKATSRSSESRATKVLAIVIGCYLLCWMPFFVWLNVMAACKHCPDSGVLGTILFWIGYSNSTFNPVIYAFFSRDFRNAFIASLRIDKWASMRSLCFKLAKNGSTQASSDKGHPIPVSRSTPKLYSPNRDRINSSPLQQQIHHRQIQQHQYTKRHSDFDHPAGDKSNGEAKEPLVTPSVVVSNEEDSSVFENHSPDEPCKCAVTSDRLCQHVASSTNEEISDSDQCPPLPPSKNSFGGRAKLDPVKRTQSSPTDRNAPVAFHQLTAVHSVQSKSGETVQAANEVSVPLLNNRGASSDKFHRKDSAKM